VRTPIVVLAVFLPALLASIRDVADAADPAPIEVQLPFPAETTWKVLEGPGGPSHADVGTKFAVDFAMAPEGQPVCAVMDGLVEFVKKDEREETERESDWNKIVVRHDDGSVAEYVHLQKDGAFFDVGERVVAGDVIGLSGIAEKPTHGPRLRFGLRRTDKDGPSAPCKFVGVDGVPTADQAVTSQNVAIRFVFGWRTVRDAVDLYKLCASVDATSSVLPLLDAAKRVVPKFKHASMDAVLRERDEVVEAHRLASVDEIARLKTAKDGKDVDALAELATIGVLDFADFPNLARDLRALPVAFGKDPKWAEAVARASGRVDYRKLVADAVKEESGAGARFVPKKTDPRSHPDYAAAIVAWDKARARAPDPDMASAIRRHAEALKKAR